MTTFLLVAIGLAMLTPAPSQAKGEKKEQRVWVAIPRHLRVRLIDRLNLYVEYERTKQYERLYDLSLESVAPAVKLDREAYVDASRKGVAKGYRSILLKFKPNGTVDLSREDEGIVRYHISGVAKTENMGKVYERNVAIEVRWINGDWYFSDLWDVIMDYGQSGAFPGVAPNKALQLTAR